MAETTALVDYYRVLRVPHDVDLDGVRNAYSRLASEFARRLEVDETCKDDLVQLNEAYNVLADPALRRDYDRIYFASDYARAEREYRKRVRHWRMSQWTAIGLLGAVVAVQAVVIVLITAANTDAITGQIVSGYNSIEGLVTWTWDQLSAFNDSIGNPVSWFKDIGNKVRQAG